MSTATMTPPKFPRSALKPGEVLCDHCSAKCCKYFALPIETPTEWTDFEYIRWYLLHGESSIFIEDENWYLCVHTVCKHLGDDNRCGIYHTRPQICREYSTDNCEYDDDWVYDHYFETAEQVWEYAEAVLGPPPGGSLRSPEPAALALL
jgi:uncharacterized protein